MTIMTELDWNNPEKIVVCRPALPKDGADVIELTRTIWDGHDYIPTVWEEWLEDMDGLLAVAEYGGKTIGLGKLTKLAENQWWLEGLRVHPGYQGRRIGSYIMEYLYKHWESNAGGIVRLATASYRLSVQHLCDRYGFKKIGEFSEFNAATISNGASAEQIGFLPVKTGQESQAAEFACKSQSLNIGSGLIDLGYRWLTPVPSLISDAIKQGNAWWWHKNQGLLLTIGWWEDNQQPIHRISLIACQLKDLPRMLNDTRCLAGALGYDQIGWVASLHSELQPTLHACGFNRDWEDAVFVYEKS